MLAAAFFSAGLRRDNGLGVAGAPGGHRGVGGAFGDPRHRLDHLPGQPAHLGRGDQLSRGGTDGSDGRGPGSSRAGRTPSLIGGGALHVDRTALRAGAFGRARHRADLRRTHPRGTPSSSMWASLCVPLTWWVLFRTRFGLRLRAVGENPAAVDTAGISVIGLRYAAVGICGLLCGLAGAYLATGLQAGFVKGHVLGPGLHRALPPSSSPSGGPGTRFTPPCSSASSRRCRCGPTSSNRSSSSGVPVQLLDALPYCPDRHHPGRFRRQGDPAEGGRGAFMSRSADDLAGLIRDRAGSEPPCRGPRARLGPRPPRRRGRRGLDRLRGLAGFSPCGRFRPQPPARRGHPRGHPRRGLRR